LFTFLCYQQFYNILPLYSVKYPATYFNRIFVTNVLLTFVVAGIFLIQHESKKTALAIVVLLAITTGLFVFGSNSETSKLIWITGWPLLLIGYLLNSKLQNIMLGILSVSPLLMPLVLKYTNALLINLSQSNIEWIRQSSGAARLGIWQETIKLIELNPIFGYGNEAMLFLTQNELLKNGLFKGGELKVGHPHNAFLQIWLEYGLVGAVLCSIFLGMISFQIAQLSNQVRPIALTLFVTIVMVSMVSHGAWQSWWLGSIILVSTIVSALAHPATD
jgi:O-antigen ligase